jgi:periplasmic protein TonB
LRQQIAQLGSEISYHPEGSDNTKAKTLAQVSTHKFMAAQYIKDWESKVERTGNLNFPTVATKKGSNSLTMDVGIQADGSIKSIRIRKSSGNAALDEAAKNIVKMSAPFAPLPSALLKELRVLVITRKWKFSDESGMTTP